MVDRVPGGIKNKNEFIGREDDLERLKHNGEISNSSVYLVFNIMEKYQTLRCIWYAINWEVLFSSSVSRNTFAYSKNNLV